MATWFEFGRVMLMFDGPATAVEKEVDEDIEVILGFTSSNSGRLCNSSLLNLAYRKDMSFSMSEGFTG